MMATKTSTALILKVLDEIIRSLINLRIKMVRSNCIEAKAATQSFRAAIATQHAKASAAQRRAG